MCLVFWKNKCFFIIFLYLLVRRKYYLRSIYYSPDKYYDIRSGPSPFYTDQDPIVKSHQTPMRLNKLVSNHKITTLRYIFQWILYNTAIWQCPPDLSIYRISMRYFHINNLWKVWFWQSLSKLYFFFYFCVFSLKFEHTKWSLLQITFSNTLLKVILHLICVG